MRCLCTDKTISAIDPAVLPMYPPSSDPTRHEELFEIAKITPISPIIPVTDINEIKM